MDKVLETKLENSQTKVDPRRLSPADLVNTYFRNHKILGPKIVSITWATAERVEVSLDNFPVESMPEFAKQKFLSGMQEAFLPLGQSFKVVLLDSKTSKILLEQDVGTVKQ